MHVTLKVTIVLRPNELAELFAESSGDLHHLSEVYLSDVNLLYAQNNKFVLGIQS